MRAVWLNRILVLLAFAGIFVAGVLSVAHAMKLIPPCGGSQDCFTVATHPSSIWFGVLPVAYVGLSGYFLLAALAIARSLLGVLSDKRLVWAGLLISGIGTVVSVVLVVYSLNVIKASCIWCMASATIMTLSFLVHGALAQQELDEAATKKVEMAPGIVLGAIALAAVTWQGLSLKAAASDPSIKADVVAELTAEQLAPPSAPSIGNSKADVTVVEFADLTCPACKDSYTAMREIFGKYRGKLRWVFRHYPLYKKEKQHQFALPAALISEVLAEKQKFWLFLDAVYSLDQEKIESLDIFYEITKALGYERAVIERRLENGEDRIYDRVHDDIQFADKVGVGMTPTFFILIKGQKPIAANVNTYKEVINSPEAQKYLGGAVAP